LKGEDMAEEIQQIEQTALTWPQKAGEIKIVDQTSYNVAAQTLKEIADIEKKIKEHHEPIKTAAHSAHKAAVAAEKKFLDPLNEAKVIIKKSISVWEQEQARIRSEIERKAREEAQKKEEEERLKRATEAEDAGKPEEEINKILDTPEPIKPIVTMPTFQRAEGVGTRETWKAEVTDLKLLAQAVATGTVPVDAIQANMPYLNSKARLDKEGFSVPGVQDIKDGSVTVR